MASHVLTPDFRSLRGMEVALASLAEVAERLPKFRDSILSALDSPADIFRLKHKPASTTREGRIRFEPADGFKVLTAALRTGDGNLKVVELACHGWPVLSVVGCTSTVAEPAAATSGGRGGR